MNLDNYVTEQLIKSPDFRRAYMFEVLAGQRLGYWRFLGIHLTEVAFVALDRLGYLVERRVGHGMLGWRLASPLYDAAWDLAQLHGRLEVGE